jgi:hypothetical protein
MPTDNDADAAGPSDEVRFDHAVLRDAIVPPTVHKAPWCFPWPDHSQIVQAKFAELRRRIADRLAESESCARQPSEDA